MCHPCNAFMNFLTIATGSPLSSFWGPVACRMEGGARNGVCRIGGSRAGKLEGAFSHGGYQVGGGHRAVILKLGHHNISALDSAHVRDGKGED